MKKVFLFIFLGMLCSCNYINEQDVNSEVEIKVDEFLNTQAVETVASADATKLEEDDIKQKAGEDINSSDKQGKQNEENSVVSAEQNEKEEGIGADINFDEIQLEVSDIIEDESQSLQDEVIEELTEEEIEELIDILFENN